MCDHESILFLNESATHNMSMANVSGQSSTSLETITVSSPTTKLAAAASVAATAVRRPVDTFVEEMVSENNWLRQKMKEITADRDRLLCEVANLRLELDMAELKRLPEDSFPQKSSDRPSPAYNVQGDAAGYVYLQQQNYTPPQQVVYPHLICHQVHVGQQSLHKKITVRNSGDVLKRIRSQNAYELSQDLLDKQIELLERKYGGVRARHAATTIQRAFRHYTMVKKFASITAMAKAEKRQSRRMIGPNQSQSTYMDSGASNMSPPYGAGIMGLDEESTVAIGDAPDNAGGQRGVCATITAMPAGSRITPVRSVSLRERRSMDASPLPRSQSGNSATSSASAVFQGASWPKSSQYSHPHVNLLHATEQNPYASASPPLYQASYQSHQGVQYLPQDISMSTGSQVDSQHSSLNSSWISHENQSPIQQYYSNQQIYMKPHISAQSAMQCSVAAAALKRVPPEVPKRTSSITLQQRGYDRQLRPNGLFKSTENGSLSSVQSSGSDSSADRVHCDMGSDRSSSPQWKRKCGAILQSPDHVVSTCTSAEAEYLSSNVIAQQYVTEQQHKQMNAATNNFKISETIRKRQYRVGLNLFNKKPERGITYLIRRGFLENTPQGVARFLISRKGLSRQMIGEYLGNLQNSFNMTVLECFARELDLSGMQVDVALRKFQAYFRMPGEAQKIERLMEIFSQRYCQCNPDVIARLRSSDTIFVLAFAIIMLNTDLHTPNLKSDRRMRVEDFIKNLRGIDDCHDIDRDMLVGIYERVKINEFKPGSDHMTQVMKVQATIVGKKPNLALPHRRLVCYCRLYEIPDINKKERPGVHQREVFLFNDLLVITKIFNKKKNSATYTFRISYPLCGIVVTLLDVPNYPYCIRLSQKVDSKILVTFNARNEHDRCKFAEDLRESISEMDEMETLRIEAELERQKSSRGNRNGCSGSSDNRDSGVADIEGCPCPFQSPQNEMQMDTTQLKRSALSNSLLDMHEQSRYESI